MKKALNLNEYTDEEIVAALLNINGMKFMAVMMSISSLTERMKTRGDTIAEKTKMDHIDQLIKDMLTGDGGEEE